MSIVKYNRLAAVEYAIRWALKRNPVFYDFEYIGGDCTNFVSQCIFAGCKIMNYTKDTGWYYTGVSNRAAAWTGVDYLYRFLISNKGVGPIGEISDLQNSQPGDVIQLSNGDYFHHSCIITGYRGSEPYVCAHTYDVLNKPLFDYFFDKMRVIHIIGVNNSY